jgi:hypothetical protein
MSRIKRAFNMAEALSKDLSKSFPVIQANLEVRDIPLEELQELAMENELKLEKPNGYRNRYSIILIHELVTINFFSEEYEVNQSFRKKKTDTVEASV